VILYHRTTAERAGSIRREGFRDGTYFIGGLELSGAWLSDRPLDDNEGADGDTLLQVSFDCAESDIADYELVQDIGYREWLIPAAFINARASVSLVVEDE
jgi:hypothetical protein